MILLLASKRWTIGTITPTKLVGTIAKPNSKLASQVTCPLPPFLWWDSANLFSTCQSFEFEVKAK